MSFRIHDRGLASDAVVAAVEIEQLQRNASGVHTAVPWGTAKRLVDAMYRCSLQCGDSAEGNGRSPRNREFLDPSTETILALVFTELDGPRDDVFQQLPGLISQIHEYAEAVPAQMDGAKLERLRDFFLALSTHAAGFRQPVSAW